jgi:hypothetical protein
MMLYLLLDNQHAKQFFFYNSVQIKKKVETMRYIINQNPSSFKVENLSQYYKDQCSSLQ